jgi:hypothetical protein
MKRFNKIVHPTSFWITFGNLIQLCHKHYVILNAPYQTLHWNLMPLSFVIWTTNIGVINFRMTQMYLVAIWKFNSRKN